MPVDAQRREVSNDRVQRRPHSRRLDHEVTETVEALTPGHPVSLAFVGAGRAGSALATALRDAGHPIAAVHSRTAAHAQRLAAATGGVVVQSAVEAMELAVITFATVPDAEIARVGAAVGNGRTALPGRALVHCSATHGAEVLAAARATSATIGAFHPLQALAGAASADLLHGASFTIEAPEPLHGLLAGLVVDLRGHLLDLPVRGRALYHAAAVLAGNAPLALLARAVDLLEAAGIDRQSGHRALSSLLAGAARNAADAGPAGALTGPVVRGDAATIARHLEALTADPATRELYRHLALEVLALAGPAGREAVAEVLAEPGAPARTVSTRRVA